MNGWICFFLPSSSSSHTEYIFSYVHINIHSIHTHTHTRTQHIPLICRLVAFADGFSSLVFPLLFRLVVCILKASVERWRAVSSLPYILLLLHYYYLLVSIKSLITIVLFFSRSGFFFVFSFSFPASLCLGKDE